LILIWCFDYVYQLLMFYHYKMITEGMTELKNILFF
jgi:hypothetical protein